MILYTNYQIESLTEYLSNNLPVYAPILPLVCAPGLRTNSRIRFMDWSGLTDQSKPIRFSACTTDPTNVSQHSPSSLTSGSSRSYGS